jgi:hypothetical protein
MDYRGAIECFDEALVANPHSASAHFELGWLVRAERMWTPPRDLSLLTVT